jgi:hypothetical protein
MCLDNVFIYLPVPLAFDVALVEEKVLVRGSDFSRN